MKEFMKAGNCCWFRCVDLGIIFDLDMCKITLQVWENYKNLSTFLHSDNLTNVFNFSWYLRNFLNEL